MSKKITSKKNIFFIIMLLITALYIGFIWWRSTLSAVDSTVESLSVLGFLESICKFLNLGVELTDHIVRKAAHFCEFALLGCLTLWTAYIKNKRVIRNLMSAGFVCLAVAVADEMIQITSPGRSAEVVDVTIDFFGACAGALFFIIVLSIVKLFKKT